MRILLPELRQLCSRVREVDVMNKIFKLIGKRGRTTVPFEIRMKMRLGYAESMKDASEKMERIIRGKTDGETSIHLSGGE